MNTAATRAIAAPAAAPRNLHEQLLNALGLHIVGAPADPAPLATEAIGEQFGASRTVVRETFRALEAKGLIRPKPNSGTRILPQRCWNLLDPQVISWRAQSPDAETQGRELAQISAALEPLTARLAAERAALLPEPERARLTQLADSLATAAQDADQAAFTAADLEFHALFLQAAGSVVLLHLAGLLHTHQAEGTGTLCPSDTASAAAHAALAAHVLQGDATRAESVARSEIASRRPGAHAVSA